MKLLLVVGLLALASASLLDGTAIASWYEYGNLTTDNWMKLWYGHNQKMSGNWALKVLDESSVQNGHWTYQASYLTSVPIPQFAPLPASILGDLYDTGAPGSFIGSFWGKDQDGRTFSFVTDVDSLDRWRCINLGLPNSVLPAAQKNIIDPNVNTLLSGPAWSAAAPQFDDRSSLWEKPDNLGTNAGGTVWWNDNGGKPVEGINSTAKWIYSNDQLPSNNHHNPFTDSDRADLVFTPHVLCRWVNLLGPAAPDIFDLEWGICPDTNTFGLKVHVAITKTEAEYFQIGRWPFNGWKLYARENTSVPQVLLDDIIPPAGTKDYIKCLPRTVQDQYRLNLFTIASVHFKDPADNRDQTVVGPKLNEKRALLSGAQIDCVGVPQIMDCWQDHSHSGWFSVDAHIYTVHAPDAEATVQGPWTVDGIEFEYSWSKAYYLVNLTGVENEADYNAVPSRFADQSDHCFNCPGFYGCDKERLNKEIYKTDPTDTCVAKLYGRISLSYLREYGFTWTDYGTYTEIAGSLWASSYSYVNVTGLVTEQWHHIRFPIRIRFNNIYPVEVSSLHSWGYHDIKAAIVHYEESIVAETNYLHLTFLTTTNRPYEVKELKQFSHTGFVVINPFVRSDCIQEFAGTETCVQQWDVDLKWVGAACILNGSYTFQMSVGCRYFGDETNENNYKYASSCNRSTNILNRDEQWFAFDMKSQDFCTYTKNLTDPQTKLKVTMKPYHQLYGACYNTGCLPAKQDETYIADEDVTFEVVVVPDPTIYPNAADYPFVLTKMFLRKIQFGQANSLKNIFQFDATPDHILPDGQSLSAVVTERSDVSSPLTRKWWSVNLVSSFLGLQMLETPVKMMATVDIEVEYALKSNPAHLMTTTMSATLAASSLLFSKNSLWEKSTPVLTSESVASTVPVGALVGGVVGAAVVLALVAVAAIFIIRRRKQSSYQKETL